MDDVINLDKVRLCDKVSYPVKPFIRWAGGKQNLVKCLFSNLPKDNICNYYEPFLGAGSLFFYGDFNSGVLSDINPHLVNAYRAIKCSPESVYDRLSYYRKRLSRDYYYEVRDLYNKSINTYSVEQAAAFIFLVHSSFNGIYRVNKRGLYNVPFGKINPAFPDLEHLFKIQSKLASVDVEVCMYEGVIEKIRKGDFVYFDPPYPPLNETSYFQHYSIDKFPVLQQEQLAEYSAYLSDKGVYVMISNAETDVIRSLYKSWNIETVQAYRFVSCKSNRVSVRELIIKNY